MSNQQDNGQLTDQKLRTGPVVDRSCTDLICFVLFVVFSIGLIVIAGYGFKNGDPHRIAQPYDPDHRACGVDSGVEDFPYIYFANPTNQKYLYVTVCVKECPSEPPTESTPTHSSRHMDTKKLECAPNSIVKKCEQNLATTNQEEMVVVYNSQLFMKTVCLPTTKAYYEQVKTSIDVETLDKISNDMIMTKWVILGSILAALILSFIFLFLIEKMAGCVVWTLIILLFGLLLTGGGLSIGYYYALSDPTKLPKDAQARIDSATLQQQAQANNVDPNNYLYMGFTLLGLSGLVLILTCCFVNRIRLAIAILETACDYVQDNFTVVLLPFVTFFIMLAYFIWWFVVALYLFSCGEVTHKDHQLPFGQFTFTRDQEIYANLHLFGLLWNQAFIIAAVEFIISGSVTIWYFQQGPRGQPGPLPLPTAIGRFFSYHMGTVALGSLLIAIIQILRLWMPYLYHNQDRLIRKNRVFRYLFKSLMCCMWCFEKCVQFINKNAYIACNMTGKNFFSSAKDVVFLILRNPLRYATVGGFGEVFTAIGRAFICVMTGLFCYIIITKSEKFKNDVVYPQAPALLCASIGFVVGSLFMAVYGIACDAILVVFIMDEEMEKQNGKGLALSCPPRLEKFLEDQQ